MQRLGKILKIVLIVAIVAVVALLAINMYKSGHKELEELVITDSFKTAYVNKGDIQTHKPQDDGFSPNGGLYSYSLAYIESQGYLQITVRYNERHMDDIKESYPDFDKDAIYYTLTDKEGNVYEATKIAEASKFHYQYYKLEFTGVNFASEELTLNMIIEALNDVIEDKSSVVVHKKGQQSLPWDLSAEEGTQLSTQIS